MTHEEIVAIKREIMSEADGRYVKLEDCIERKEEVNKKFANDDKRIEIIAHDFGIIKKLMWAVATSGIGSLVVAFIELLKGI